MPLFGIFPSPKAFIPGSLKNKSNCIYCSQSGDSRCNVDTGNRKRTITVLYLWRQATCNTWSAAPTSKCYEQTDCRRPPGSESENSSKWRPSGRTRSVDLGGIAGQAEKGFWNEGTFTWKGERAFLPPPFPPSSPSSLSLPQHTHTHNIPDTASSAGITIPFYRLKIEKQQIEICSRPHSWKELITSLDLSMNPLLG